MRIVLCRGVFDLLHAAHVRHLQEARGMGDILVVSLTPDDVAEREKRRPITPQDERAEIVGALWCVAHVPIDADYREAILRWQPAIYCKGSDHIIREDEREICARLGIEIRQTKPNPQHTKAIREKLCA